MIQAIGLMIGAYIIVRMLAFVDRKGDREESLGIKILAFLCVLWTAFMMVLVVISGTSIPTR